MNESGKFVSKQRSNFSMVGNTILRDDRMSLKAKIDNEYKEIKNYIVSTGKDNIIRQIEVFRNKSNIKPKKEIDRELIDASNN